MAKAGFVIYLPKNAALMVPRRAFDDDAAFVYFRNAVNQIGRPPG